MVGRHVSENFPVEVRRDLAVAVQALGRKLGS